MLFSFPSGKRQSRTLKRRFSANHTRPPTLTVLYTFPSRESVKVPNCQSSIFASDKGGNKAPYTTTAPFTGKAFSYSTDRNFGLRPRVRAALRRVKGLPSNTDHKKEAFLSAINGNVSESHSVKPPKMHCTKAEYSLIKKVAAKQPGAADAFIQYKEKTEGQN